MSEVGGGDCNSNPATTATTVVAGSPLTTSQDVEFIQDHSDYQWFIDYGYRDGSVVQHTSILTSICNSYTGIEDVGFYDAMSKNLDANLAEADMESFRTEDIHSLLTTLPTICSDLQIIQEKNREGEMYASMSGSLMEKIDLDSSLSQQTSSQGADSSGLIDTMSICKSELLFSPVKETPLHAGHAYSVDSLDCGELPTEEDILLTCQANKNNYTIAFEGSVSMSDDTFHRQQPLDVAASHINKLTALDTSMAQSDLGLTTWSKLKKRSTCETTKLRRHPSGNNNTTTTTTSSGASSQLCYTSAKSQSMPDLCKKPLQRNSHSTRHFLNNLLSHTSSSNDSCCQRYAGVKVFDIQHNSGSLFSDIATATAASSVDGFDSSCSDHRHQYRNMTTARNLNLVKRFIKQKSIGADGMEMSKSSEYTSSLDNRSKITSSMNDNDHLHCDNNTEFCNVQYNRTQLNNWLSTECTQAQVDVGPRRRELFNVNNNNSIDRSSVPASSSAESASVSMCSSSEVPTETTARRRHLLQTRLSLVDRSIQTSKFENPSPIRLIEPSFLNKLKSDNKLKPVYVLYPDYTLPSLDFMKNSDDLTNIFLFPQKFVPHQDKNVATKPKAQRPFSCNDIETLKKKGFGHVKDWESLTFLLPHEYRQLLADVPEVIEQMRPDDLLRQKEKPLFCVTPPMRHRQMRPQSCDLTGTNVSSSSSTATQPSSGYRGSSTMLLTDSVKEPTSATFNPLFIYRYDSVTSSDSFVAPPLPRRSTSLPNGEVCPPRPALPKGILRKSLAENNLSRKCSTRDRRNRLNSIETETDESYADEGVDAGGSESDTNDCILPRPPTPPKTTALDAPALMSSQDELQQLEDFLKQSGISCSETDEWDDNDVLKLRTCVNKFLSLKINQNRKKSVSFSNHLVENPPREEFTKYTPIKNVTQLPICEEAENSSEERTPNTSPKRNVPSNLMSNEVFERKTDMITAVKDAVDQIIDYFAVANNREELELLGDVEQSPTCAKLLLSTLCPALYAVLSDGLKPNIETAFGTIGNSVWQVVEGSAHDGPLTKSLNELVTRINTEDVITEGLIKFNSFIFGLLNVQSLDVWLSYLRMRESILRKHYDVTSLLLAAHTGGSAVRGLVDLLVATLQPLNMLPFRIDLMFEYRQLHISLKRMSGAISTSGSISPTHLKVSPTKAQLSTKQWTLFKIVRSIQNSLTQDDVEEVPIEVPPKPRPRSFVDPTNDSAESDMTVNKRWSDVHIGSKLHQAFDRLAAENSDDEDYTDSLEPEISEKQRINEINRNVKEATKTGTQQHGVKFKRLQMKWEMLANETTNGNSPPSSAATSNISTNSNRSKTPESPVRKESPCDANTTPNGKSKIPRLIPSPVRANSTLTNACVQKSNIPTSSKKATVVRRQNTDSNLVRKKVEHTTPTRTSRMDQHETGGVKHAVRPTSLPYSQQQQQQAKGSKLTPPRRAASTSAKRINKAPVKATPKVVQTLTRRLPADNGHLSFNRGEQLAVLLVVDQQWLLCSRGGSQKGLVPRSAVVELF